MPAANPKEYNAGWRERNRQKLRRKAATYYEANRDACRQRMVEYRRRQREKREWFASAPIGSWSGLIA